VRGAILQQLIARHEFDVPPSLVERRTDALLGALRLDLPAGTDRERALASVRVQLRPRAEEQVRAELLLDAIAAKEGIAASDDDVETEIVELASRERRVVEQVRAFYERPETRAALRAKIARDRALAGLIACARVMPSSAAESVAHEK
jgi:trigger factor